MYMNNIDTVVVIGGTGGGKRKLCYELARVGLSRDPDQSHVWNDLLPEFVYSWVSQDSFEPVRRQ
jgi:predicted ATPase